MKLPCFLSAERVDAEMRAVMRGIRVRALRLVLTHLHNPVTLLPNPRSASRTQEAP